MDRHLPQQNDVPKVPDEWWQCESLSNCTQPPRISCPVRRMAGQWNPNQVREDKHPKHSGKNDLSWLDAMNLGDKKKVDKKLILTQFIALTSKFWCIHAQTFYEYQSSAEMRSGESKRTQKGVRFDWSNGGMRGSVVGLGLLATCRIGKKKHFSMNFQR